MVLAELHNQSERQPEIFGRGLHQKLFSVVEIIQMTRSSFAHLPEQFEEENFMIPILHTIACENPTKNGETNSRVQTVDKIQHYSFSRKVFRLFVIELLDAGYNYTGRRQFDTDLPILGDINAVSLYFGDMGRYDRISDVEEIFLFHQIETAEKERSIWNNSTKAAARRRVDQLDANIKESQHAIVEGNIRLVISCAKKYAETDDEFLDLIQIGNISLMERFEAYKFRTGIRFGNYSVPAVRTSINRYKANEIRKQTSVSLDQKGDEFIYTEERNMYLADPQNQFSNVEVKLIQAKAAQIIDSTQVSDYGRQVLRIRLGLEPDFEGFYTWTEIGDALGKSRQSVQAAYKKAWRKVGPQVKAILYSFE